MKIRKATVVEAFGKYQGQGYFVLVFDGYDNQTMGTYGSRVVYKTRRGAEAAAKRSIGQEYKL